jgi:hypothetical protein
MKDNQQKLIESNYSKTNPAVITEEKSLILLEFNAEKNVDQTISNPEKYVSWYQYNTKNIDKYLQLCPHCKKPTLSAFDRSVIDSAIDYINGKRMLGTFPRNEGKFSVGVFLMIAFAIIFYFIFNQISL